MYEDIIEKLEREDYEAAYAAISQRMQQDPTDYVLFYLLARYYGERNPYQSYLCFEQAEFYCKDAADLDSIRDEKQKLQAEGIAVPNLAVVIVSYMNCREMRLCLESLRANIPDSYEIIVVDNASSDEEVLDYLKTQERITFICNKKNKGFPAGCNQGIKSAKPDSDILLLNNDTIVFPNSLFWLRMGLYEEACVGAVGAMSSASGNDQQIEEEFESLEAYTQYARSVNIPMQKPYEKRVRLVGFAMMLKRKALDAVGLLDERFSPGNMEDDDLSLRLLMNDYKLMVCKNSFIFHFGGKSFRKNWEGYINVLSNNEKKFQEKWGFSYHYYGNIRKDLRSFFEERENMNVLEVGCGMGATLGFLSDEFPTAKVYGIELCGTVVSYAKHYIPTIMQGNIETMSLADCYEKEMFDYILFPDVLEHLHRPETVLEKIKGYLKPSGCVIASLPNIMHYSVIIELLKGNFTYQDAGVLDRAHLRFFTLKEILIMFVKCGYEVLEVKPTYYDFPVPIEDQEMYKKLLQLPGVASEANFVAYQYLVKVRKKA